MKRLLRLGWAKRGLLVEATFLLLASRARIAWAELRRRKPDFGRLALAAPEQPAPEWDLPVRAVAWAVAAASRHVPWDATCLSQAMAAKAMLKRRGIDSTLYLGVCTDPERGALAHAWLRVGSTIVTGGSDRARFTTVAYFT